MSPLPVSPLDAPSLVLLGVVAAAAYRQRLRPRNEDWFVLLGIAAVGAFWLNLLGTTLAGIQPWGIAPAVETDSLALAVFYPLAYPLWFRLGGRAVFLLFGRRPEEGGVLWVYRIEDDTEEFDPAWES